MAFGAGRMALLGPGERCSDQPRCRNSGSGDVLGSVGGGRVRRMGAAGLEEQSLVRRASVHLGGSRLQDGQVERMWTVARLRMAHREQNVAPDRAATMRATPSTLLLSPHGISELKERPWTK
jgi:hypothetical protein